MFFFFNQIRISGGVLIPGTLMINVKINNETGSVGCELCRHEVGLLRFDKVLVILLSSRPCNLEYVSTVSEHTPNSQISIVVNRLVELCMSSENGDSSVSSDDFLSDDESGSEAIELEQGNQLETESVSTGELVNELVELDLIQPSNQAVQVPVVSSTSRPDSLEQLVAEILGEDNDEVWYRSPFGAVAEPIFEYEFLPIEGNVFEF